MPRHRKVFSWAPQMRGSSLLSWDLGGGLEIYLEIGGWKFSDDSGWPVEFPRFNFQISSSFQVPNIKHARLCRSGG